MVSLLIIKVEEILNWVEGELSLVNFKSSEN